MTNERMNLHYSDIDAYISLIAGPKCNSAAYTIVHEKISNCSFYYIKKYTREDANLLEDKDNKDVNCRLVLIYIYISSMRTNNA